MTAESRIQIRKKKKNMTAEVLRPSPGRPINRLVSQCPCGRFLIDGTGTSRATLPTVNTTFTRLDHKTLFYQDKNICSNFSSKFSKANADVTNIPSTVNILQENVAHNPKPCLPIPRSVLSAERAIGGQLYQAPPLLRSRLLRRCRCQSLRIRGRG